jgi:hypothetical protein
MPNDLVGSIRKGEVASGMSFLPAGFAPRRLSQGDGLLETVAGRRLATVVAVFAQAVFQFFDPCRQGVNLLLLGFQDAPDGIRALFVNRLELFACKFHVEIVPYFSAFLSRGLNSYFP